MRNGWSRPGFIGKPAQPHRRTRRSLGALLIVGLLALAHGLPVHAVGSTNLVKDINTQDNPAASSSPTGFVQLGATLALFSANGELWRSNGTANATVQIKDINPTGVSNPALLTNIAGTVFFTANDGVHGTELWKSNGTPASTVMVKDIKPGTASSAISTLTNVNGTLFFVADDGTHGYELWKSSEGGTP